jgi:hypothetical protein
VLHHLVESRDYTRIFGLTDGGRSSTETAATGFKLASAITARQDRRQNAGVAETLATLKAARARDLALNHRIREARNARGAAIKIASRYYTEPLTA